MIIHELIEAQALHKPGQAALTFGPRTLTYGELNQAANRMAWSLLQRGVQPEQFVAVRLERSIEAAIALLGILKAGAAWIYLEPDLPSARVDVMLSDALPRVVIARGDVGFLDSGHSDNPAVVVTPAFAACLLYTSGSTGRPKAAIEIHRSLTARLEFGPLPDILPGDVCCLNSSLAFGMTASRLLLPLAQGARVVIAPEEVIMSIPLFADLLAEHAVSSLFLPPVLLRALLQLGAPALAALAAIRAVTVGGSSVTPDLVRAFFQAFPQAMLVNLYGSTEIGSTATIKVMTDASEADVISIGRPVPGAILHIFDDALQPVADGDLGELYVGTQYLAREYLNQPELTAERFVADPLHPDQRIYRTGDLARRLPTGEVQLAGRRDHQVKIRGNRVEIGEVEAALERHPSVLEAAVIVHDDALVGYVATSGSLSATALRAYVHQQLPSAMRPAAYLFVPRLPRTTGGKVDRRNLPSYDPSRPELDTPFVPPRSGPEVEAAGIWSRALRLHQIGIHDHFLDLGGDSLAAIEVVIQCEQHFHLRLEVDAVFDLTVAELVAKLDSRASA